MVAIIAALSGAVLTTINRQLGCTGDMVAAEYAFYVFFALSTLWIVSSLVAERLRVPGENVIAVWI
jgi:hypothetical protein